MSETTSVLEREQGYASDSVDRETIDDNWDEELFALVAENADILVRCPWMSDAEVSLSAAMIAYPELMTHENLSLYLSVVQQLLANRVTETEEPAEGDEPEEEQPAETEEAGRKNDTKNEVQKVQENSNTVDAGRQSKKEIVEAKHLELPTIKAERTPASKNSTLVAAEAGVTAKLVQSESQQSSQGAAKAETTVSSPNSPSNNTSDTTSGGSTGVPETLAVISRTSRSSAQELTPIRTSDKDELNESKPAIKSKVEPKQQVPRSEVAETDVTVDSVVETKPAPNNSQLVADEQAEPYTLPVSVEIIAEPKPTELLILDLEDPAISDDVTELSDEKFEAVEDESTLNTTDYQLDIDEITDFAEAEEGILDYFEEAVEEPDELQEIFSLPALEVVEDNLEAEETSTFELDNESNLFGQMEITSQEQLVQTSLTIEEIEDSLIQLAEGIEASEPETVETVYEILDKIIEVPTRFEAQNGENIITESEAQDELEELFAELLEEIGIDYTPELIESLAYLTLKWHLADEIEQLKNEEEADEAPQDTGTHEIIKKLLAGLSVIKKAMTHACSIGKSALQLYSFNFAT